MANASVVHIRPSTGLPDTVTSSKIDLVMTSTTKLTKEKPTMFSRIVRKFPCTSVKTSDSESEKHRPKTSTGVRRFGADAGHKSLLHGYNTNVEKIRDREYPGLKGRAYLDNAGTQLPAKSLIDEFAKDLGSHLYGNPHTHSLPARNSVSRVAGVRRRALEFFKADPEEFDLVFVANASAAIKLVGEGLRDYVEAGASTSPHDDQPYARKLHYAYHKDAHNSLIGLREFATSQTAFRDDVEVESWLESGGPSYTNENGDDDAITLFAYPGQSNMTGRRLPLHWLRAAKQRTNTYTLLDAAALSTTKQLDLSSWAPDFTAISFYKIFGFPDLGGLIVRKAAAHVLTGKKFFAGGTVDGVTVFGDKPLMVRRESVHEVLEEGTLPFHNIIALDHALDTHARLFKNMDTISAHVAALTRYCAHQLRDLTYVSTNQPLCEIYSPESLFASAPLTSLHGGTIALNIYTSSGSKIPYRSIERAADHAGIYVRSGAMCNPGGMATYLGWDDAEGQPLNDLFAAGMRCSNPIEVFKNKWTGVVRVSFGAGSTRADVDRLVGWLRREYLEGKLGRA